MNHDTRNRINAHIQSRGYHLYVISSSDAPRYVYTIGLKERIGYELCLAGAMFFNLDEVEEIFSHLIGKLKGMDDSRIELLSYGAVELLDVGNDWVEGLFFGSLDFYGEDFIKFKQIYLHQFKELIDVPNCSLPLDQSLWSDSLDSEYNTYTAVVNKEVLNNEAVLEVMRWEQNEWEMFSYAGPNVPKNNLRIIPLKVCLRADTSLKNSLTLNVGKGAWREKRESKWNEWG